MLTCPILVTYASKTAMEEKTQTIFTKPSMKREKTRETIVKQTQKITIVKTKLLGKICQASIYTRLYICIVSVCHLVLKFET